MMMVGILKGGTECQFQKPCPCVYFYALERHTSHRQLLLRLPLWVRRQQEREFETPLSLLSRKHKVRNKSLIIKWNKALSYIPGGAL